MSNLMMGTPTAVAGGTIPQASFCKVDPTSDYQFLAAGVGDEAVGISQRWANVPTFDTQTSTPPAALIGQGFVLYRAGVECQLIAGAGGWPAGAKLKPDANGAGVVAAAGDKYAAEARQATKQGELGQVTVRLGTV